MESLIFYFSPENRAMDKRIGIASFLSCFCEKCGKSCILSSPCNNGIKSKSNLTAYSTKIEDYNINIKFLLALQCICGGTLEAALISAFLNLGVDAFKNTFTSMEEHLAVHERKLGKEQIQTNLEYVACHPMSRVCIKCKLSKTGKCDDSTYCPRNYEGSSKGMESVGALKNVLSIWENSNKQAYVADWTADEDSSSSAILKWSYKEARDIKKIPWPVNDKGNKKPNYGKLPITHPVQPEKNDGNHAINAFCKPIFAMVQGKGTKKRKPCMADARRLKRNLQYVMDKR